MKSKTRVRESQKVLKDRLGKSIYFLFHDDSRRPDVAAVTRNRLLAQRWAAIDGCYFCSAEVDEKSARGLIEEVEEMVTGGAR